MELTELLQEISDYTQGQIAMAKINGEWRYIAHAQNCQPENWEQIQSNGVANDIQSVGYNMCRHSDGTLEHVSECSDCFALPFNITTFDAQIITPTVNS